MKTAILIPALLLLSWGCFAQVKQKPYLTRLPVIKPLSGQVMPGLKSSLGLRQFSTPGSSQNTFGKPKESGLTAGSKKENSGQIKGSMPILKPDSTYRYPMLAAKPDSTIRYHLRIKQPEK